MAPPPRNTATAPAAARSMPRARRPSIAELSALATASIPEVAAADRVVGLQLVARAGENDAAGLEHVAGLRGLQGEVGVLLDDEDGEALVLVQLADDPEELRDEHGSQAE